MNYNYFIYTFLLYVNRFAIEFNGDWAQSPIPNRFKYINLFEFNKCF